MSRNPIWNYLTKSEQHAGKAKYTECSKLLSLGNDKSGFVFVFSQKMFFFLFCFNFWPKLMNYHFWHQLPIF